jgi:hypothetical protein
MVFLEIAFIFLAFEKVTREPLVLLYVFAQGFGCEFYSQDLVYLLTFAFAVWTQQPVLDFLSSQRPQSAFVPCAESWSDCEPSGSPWKHSASHSCFS